MEQSNENEKSLISVIIKNVKGSLSKVTSYCAQNEMNIERLVLSNFKTDNLQHRVIMYITGDRKRISSLLEGMLKLDVVVKVSNFIANNYIERELLLLKVKANDINLPKISDLVNEFDGKTIFFRDKVMVFQFTNEENRNEELLKRLEAIDSKLVILKSGVVATSIDENMEQ